MVSWRAKKQLSILVIFALPLIGIGFLLTYLLLPAPSCSDRIQNQGELGVDCGGPCESCALKNAQPPVIFWARAVEVRENTFDVVAFVENPNEVLSAPQLTYEFTLFDALGPVAVRAGETFILAQERIHVIEANVQTTREPTRVEFKIVGVSWQLREEERPNVLVERRDYKVVDDGKIRKSTIEANILNRTPFDIRATTVNFVVLDADGNVLGANRIEVDRLLSGVSRQVKSVWPLELRGEIARIEVEPRVNVFDPALILKPQ